MELIVFLIILVIVYSIERIIKENWISSYYDFGIKIYERKTYLHNNSIEELFTKLISSNSEIDYSRVRFYLSENHDRILFRGKYPGKKYDYFVLHGNMKRDNDFITIKGYLGVYPSLFILLMTYIIFYFAKLIFTSGIDMFIGMLMVGAFTIFYIWAIIYSIVKTKLFLDYI